LSISYSAIPQPVVPLPSLPPSYDTRLAGKKFLDDIAESIHDGSQGDRHLASLMESARNGSVMHAYLLATCSLEGFYGPQDVDEAKSMFMDLGDRGYWGAKGMCYKYGWRTFHPSHRHNNHVKDQVASITWEKGAEEQDAPSMYELGRSYRYGLNGCPIDKKKALPLLVEAANQKFAPAMTEVALCYERGCAGEKRADDVFELYKEAAAQGWPAAVFHLAACYERGLGVEQRSSRRDACVI